MNNNITYQILNILFVFVIIILFVLFATVPIVQKDTTAQQVIDNEILSKKNNNGGEYSNVNEFVPKPQVHVSIEGTENPDKIRGGNGNDIITGEEGDDTLQGNEGDDKIDGGDGDDVIDGGYGNDELKGGKGADRFVCDEGDKIIDYNSLENDRIIGQCEYEDKGLIIPEPAPEKEIFKKPTPEKNPHPIFPNSAILSTGYNHNNNNFKKVISKFIDMQITRIFK